MKGWENSIVEVILIIKGY